MGVDISTADPGARGSPAGRGRTHFRRDAADGVRPALQHQVRQEQAAAVQVQRRQRRQVGGASSTSASLPKRRPRPARTSAPWSASSGAGMVFINCMEKLTMNAPKDTLKRAPAPPRLDARHRRHHARRRPAPRQRSRLIEDHPRFRDVPSSASSSVLAARAAALPEEEVRALGRMPDYVVVEGPLAGGHLGFGMDWAAVRPRHHRRRRSATGCCAQKDSTSR
jgi:hypothetical protein